jgi:hypothetical protein
MYIYIHTKNIVIHTAVSDSCFLFFQFTDSEVIKEKEVFPKREPLSSGEEVKIDCNRDVIIAEPVINDGLVAIAIIPRARLFPKAATPIHPKVHEHSLVPEVEKGTY